MISYDFPLNEQIRTFLRLQHLFRRLFYWIEQKAPQDHHGALLTLFEIIDVTARADVKSDLLQCLDRQRVALAPLRGNVNVLQEPLEKTLSDLEMATYDLHASKGKFGEHLRNQEWLMGIKQRTGIPGGMCDFDLPGYHYWLSRAPEERRQHLQDWLAPLLPTYHGLKVHLALLQESGRALHLEACQGLYQQAKVGPEVRLLRVLLAEDQPCVPEISANKYQLNIRFMEAGEAIRPGVFAADLDFTLLLCSL